MVEAAGVLRDTDVAAQCPGPACAGQADAHRVHSHLSWSMAWRLERCEGCGGAEGRLGGMPVAQGSDWCQRRRQVLLDLQRDTRVWHPARSMLAQESLMAWTPHVFIWHRGRPPQVRSRSCMAGRVDLQARQPQRMHRASGCCSAGNTSTPTSCSAACTLPAPEQEAWATWVPGIMHSAASSISRMGARGLSRPAPSLTICRLRGARSRALPPIVPGLSRPFPAASFQGPSAARIAPVGSPVGLMTLGLGRGRALGVLQGGLDYVGHVLGLERGCWV